MDEARTAEATEVKDVLIELGNQDLNEEAFLRLATVISSSDTAFHEVKGLLADWEPVAKEMSSKANAGVLQGYCHLMVGDIDGAEDALKAQRRTEWGAYYYIQTLLSKSRLDDAVAAAEDAHDKLEGLPAIVFTLVECYLRAGKTEEGGKLLQKLKRAQEGTAPYFYHMGLFHEKLGDYHAAIQEYRQAGFKDPQNAEAFFRLGFLLDLYGTEADDANEDAVAAYEACVRIAPIRTNAVINLGLLYEDRERYHDAIKCYETVLRRFPNHPRARLYLGDAQAATKMFYDKEQEKQADRQSQVLKIPVSDFELSVRSRNCLQKMNIETLGDLIMKTEQELLAYKNFGETSLAEIKEMLAQKGLRLGQGLENKGSDSAAGRNPLEATTPAEVLDKPIEDLDLSVRSRRCMERLDVRTVRDLINKTEVELMSAKNFGMTSLNEIKRKLSDLGLFLRS